MIIIQSNNQNYYGKQAFLSFFSIIHTEMAKRRQVNLIFKGSDLKNFIGVGMKKERVIL